MHRQHPPDEFVLFLTEMKLGFSRCTGRSSKIIPLLKADWPYFCLCRQKRFRRRLHINQKGRFQEALIDISIENTKQEDQKIYSVPTIQGK